MRMQFELWGGKPCSSERQQAGVVNLACPGQRDLLRAVGNKLHPISSRYSAPVNQPFATGRRSRMPPTGRKLSAVDFPENDWDAKIGIRISMAAAGFQSGL